VPSYAQKISGFKALADIDWYPKHPTIEIISGWKFDCFFADWTLYFPRLIQEFSDNKGVFITDYINLNSFKNINEDIIINCTGIGSHQLEEENIDPIVLLGHLLKIDQTPQLLSPDNNTVSYNFSPGKDIYSDSFGTPFDVYAYPRKNDWVLGGSRFKGTLDSEGKWVSKDPLSDQFPFEIEKLNAEILKHTFGVDLESFGKIEQQKAYRYVRNIKDGLRIEQSKNSDRMVIHNYGHGGAGVTLSWGAAFEVLTILAATNISDTYSIEEVSEIIRNL
jgi:glycine/D-amino acid oxidase-like deaminating enzyme